MRRSRVGQPTRLRQSDAIREALAAIVARPGRAILTSLGVGLAVAWFVAAPGLVSTASGQVASAFESRLATRLTVSQPKPGPLPAAYPYPADLSRRLLALPGVLAAGVYWPVTAAGQVNTPGSQATAGAALPVLAASAGYLAAAEVQIGQGRPYGNWAQGHAAAACVVGAVAARALGVAALSRQPVIGIGDESCAVTGIISHAPGQPALLRSVLLPTSTALAMFGAPRQPQVLIRVRPGAAPVVASQVPAAIDPARPGRYRVSVPPSPQRLTDQVTRPLTGLFAVIGWVSLAIGVLILTAVTWLSVLERAPEYALRRAFGARRRHVVLHVMWESALLGLLGGLAGASLGVAVVVLVAHARGWMPVVAPLTVWPAPLAGVAAGALAGLLPAIRAGSIQPAIALRAGG